MLGYVIEQKLIEPSSKVYGDGNDSPQHGVYSNVIELPFVVLTV